MFYDLLLPTVCLKFQNIQKRYLLSNWKWKLDPWIRYTHFGVPEDSVVWIFQSETSSIPVEINGMDLIQKEKSGFFERRVSVLSDGGTLWDFVRVAENRIYLRFYVNPEWNIITLLIDKTATQGQVAFEYLAQIMPGVCLKHNLLTFHSALVEYKNQAFAICAPSGIGKTTHARLWRDYKNALILNGDRAVMGKEGEQWIAYGIPWSGTGGEQINRHAPLKALVILERSEDNSVEKLEGFRAFTGILPHLIYPAWDKMMSETAIDKLNELLCDIPVYRLFCRPDTEAVDVLYRALYEG